MAYFQCSRKFVRKYFRVLVSILISFSLLPMPPAIAVAGQNSPEFELSGTLAQTALETPTFNQQMLTFADEIESGNIGAKQFTDPTYQVGQQLIAKGKTYDLIKERTLLPKDFNKNSLQLKIKSRGRELQIDGIFGANAEGEHGQVMATHTITFPTEILTVTDESADPEILMVFNADGSISALSRAVLLDSVFETPIPVFSKIWEVDPDNQIQVRKFEELLLRRQSPDLTLRSHFLNIGSSPDLLLNIRDALVLPLEIQNQMEKGIATSLIEHFAGTYYIGDSANRTIAMIPRISILVGMLKGAVTMQLQTMLLHPEKGFSRPESVQLIQAFEKQFNDLVQDVEERDLSPLQKSVFDQRTPDEMAILDRAIGNLLKGVNSTAPVDVFNAKQSQELLQASLIKANLNASNQLALETNLAQYVQKLQETIVDPLKQKGFSETLLGGSTKKIHELFLKVIPNKKARTVLCWSLAGGVYLGYAHFYNLTGGYQIPMLFWLYEHGYPPGLKDLAIRNSAFAGFLVGAAITPMLEIFSSGFGGVFKALGKYSQNGKGRFSQLLRSFADTWGDATAWQRIAGMSCRVTAIFTFPYLRLVTFGLTNSFSYLVGDVGRQKSLLHSLRSGVNPLMKNSETGSRVGFNSPFLSSEALNQRTQENKKAQEQVVSKNKSIDKIALDLAIIIVSEKWKITPDVLLTAPTISAQGLQQILQDPKLKAEAKLLQFAIAKNLHEASADQIASALNRNGKAFLTYYQRASEVAEAIAKSRSAELKNKVSLAWFEFQAGLKSSLYFLNNLGYENAKAFWHAKPKEINQDALQQTKAEYLTDNLLVSGLSAMVGPFADSSHPEKLFGETRFPYLSGMGLNITGTTTVGYLFQGLPANLLTSGIKQSSIDNPYPPYEELAYHHVDRVEGAASTFFQEWKSLLNFRKSDLGGSYLKRFKSRWSLFQFILISTVGLQMSTLGWSFSDSMAVFFTAEMGKYLFYRHQWEWIRVGAQMNKQRYAENVKTLNSLKVQLGKVLRADEIPAESFAAIQEGYREILGQYWKSNPTVLKRTYELTKNMLKENDLVSLAKPMAQDYDHYGLAYQLLSEQVVLKDLRKNITANPLEIQKQEERVSRLQEMVIESFANETHPEPGQEYIVESAKGLLGMLRSNSHLVTRAQENYQTVKTFVFGAVGTTLIGNLLVDIASSKEILSNPTLLYGIPLVSAAFMAASWALASARAWEFYDKKWVDIKKAAQIPTLVAVLNLKENSRKVEDKVAPFIYESEARPRTCQTLFSTF